MCRDVAGCLAASVRSFSFRHGFQGLTKTLAWYEKGAAIAIQCPYRFLSLFLFYFYMMYLKYPLQNITGF